MLYDDVMDKLSIEGYDIIIKDNDKYLSQYIGSPDEEHRITKEMKVEKPQN